MSKVLKKIETIKELAKGLSNFSWKPWLLKKIEIIKVDFFNFIILKN